MRKEAAAAPVEAAVAVKQRLLLSQGT